MAAGVGQSIFDTMGTCEIALACLHFKYLLQTVLLVGAS